jgi:hypothetical protein
VRLPPSSADRIGRFGITLLETVINWGRHAEIFAYDYDTEVLNLANF